MLIQHNVSLQPYNSMAIDAKAASLTEVNSIEELELALNYAEQHNLQPLVLGEGSNTLFKCDYPGLVILNRLLGINLLSETSDQVMVKVAAGENWHQFVTHSIKQGWFGLENLALIPGLVGAAPMQNIGAYGVELKDTLFEVEYLDIETRQLLTRSNQQCEFAYRESCFKHELCGKVVITAVTFELSKRAEVNITYPALANQFDVEPTPQKVFDAVCQIRSAKLPLPDSIPNTGSFFKNPVIGLNQHEDLLKRYPDLISYQVDGGYKLAAGWLIEKAGWKNKSIDGVTVSHTQALVLINPEKRPGQSVIKCAQQIQEDIYKLFDVRLEIEPRIY